jgi:hypothetical protein
MKTIRVPPSPDGGASADRPASDGREARLAAALRANLRRRKKLAGPSQASPPAPDHGED